MPNVELTPAKLAEWKKELRRSIDEQVPLPRCLNTKNMLSMVEEIERLQEQNYHLRLKLYIEELDGKQESEAGQ